MTRSNLADVQVIYQTATERAVCVRETEDRISVDTLRQLLRLDPATGRLFWRKREMDINHRLEAILTLIFNGILKNK